MPNHPEVEHNPTDQSWPNGVVFWSGSGINKKIKSFINMNEMDGGIPKARTLYSYSGSCCCQSTLISAWSWKVFQLVHSTEVGPTIFCWTRQGTHWLKFGWPLLSCDVWIKDKINSGNMLRPYSDCSMLLKHQPAPWSPNMIAGGGSSPRNQCHNLKAVQLCVALLTTT